MSVNEYRYTILAAFRDAMNVMTVGGMAKKQQDIWGVTKDDYEEAANYQELQTQGWQQQQELEDGHE